MSGKVIQTGFVTFGHDQTGELAQKDVAIVRGTIWDGECGFVVVGTSFHHVVGLPQGEGYLLYEGYPLEGSEDGWEEQINAYLSKDFDEQAPHTKVDAGTKTALAQQNFFIVAE